MSLSVYADVAPYSVEALKTCSSLSPAVDDRSLLLDRTARLHFFTLQSKEAPPMFNQNFGNLSTTAIGLLSEELTN